MIGLLCAVGGCGGEARVPQFVSVKGELTALSAETHELTLRARDELGRAADSVSCLMNSHSEIYINDRAGGIDALSVGDQLEIIGYRDRSARLDTIVVTYAYVTKPIGPPTLPDLSPAATRRP